MTSQHARGSCAPCRRYSCPHHHPLSLHPHPYLAHPACSATGRRARRHVAILVYPHPLPLHPNLACPSPPSCGVSETAQHTQTRVRCAASLPFVASPSPSLTHPANVRTRQHDARCAASLTQCMDEAAPPPGTRSTLLHISSRQALARPFTLCTSHRACTFSFRIVLFVLYLRESKFCYHVNHKASPLVMPVRCAGNFGRAVYSKYGYMLPVYSNSDWAPLEVHFWTGQNFYF